MGTSRQRALDLRKYDHGYEDGINAGLAWQADNPSPGYTSGGKPPYSDRMSTWQAVAQLAGKESAAAVPRGPWRDGYGYGWEESLHMAPRKVYEDFEVVGAALLDLLPNWPEAKVLMVCGAEIDRNGKHKQPCTHCRRNPGGSVTGCQNTLSRPNLGISGRINFLSLASSNVATELFTRDIIGTIARGLAGGKCQYP